jgi:DNA repair protein RadA/Sms
VGWINHPLLQEETKMRIKFSDSFEIGTPIKNISIPPELLKRQLTGIDWIDKSLGGEGFTPSQVVLFTGESGAGKTTALLSIASGITRNGGVCLYNTAEESLFQVKRVVERLCLPANFLVGCETNLNEIIEGADKIRNLPENKGKPFFLIVDSIQCIDDGKFSTGRTTCWTPERVLEGLTTWAKENFTHVIVIGQVTKSGVFSGTNKMKHMVDCHMHLSFEKKDKELLGYRKLAVPKNRFGGGGYTSWLSLNSKGFTVVATSGSSEE